jgi:pimeloyl-ACP methyl ester carboxylesterase
MRMARLRFAVVLMLVVGCSGPTGTAPTVPTAARPSASLNQSTASFARAPCPVPNVSGIPQLDLGPDFSCGYLTVPENRSRADGPTIRIAVARVKATSPTPEPDPIVWLTGGPGGTAIATANLTVAKGINADREIIFVDQRGTLHAEPALSCPEIDAVQRETLGLAIADAATAQKSDAATRTCRERLAGQGIDLAAYDTAENAADIADLRVALGIEQWNVRGVSYGTDLALQLLREHPQGIRSVVLDSLVPPQLNLVEALWPNAALGYEALFTACAAQVACAAAFPDLREEFIATVRRLDEQPLTVEVPDPAGGPNIRVVLDGYKLGQPAERAGAQPREPRRRPGDVARDLRGRRHTRCPGPGRDTVSARAERIRPAVRRGVPGGGRLHRPREGAGGGQARPPRLPRTRPRPTPPGAETPRRLRHLGRRPSPTLGGTADSQRCPGTAAERDPGRRHPTCLGPRRGHRLDEQRSRADPRRRA